MNPLLFVIANYSLATLSSMFFVFSFLLGSSMPKELPGPSEHTACGTSKDKSNTTAPVASHDTKDTGNTSGSGSRCSSEKDSGYSGQLDDGIRNDPSRGCFCFCFQLYAKLSPLQRVPTGSRQMQKTNNAAKVRPEAASVSKHRSQVKLKQMAKELLEFLLLFQRSPVSPLFTSLRTC